MRAKKHLSEAGDGTEFPDLSGSYAHKSVEVGFDWEDKDGGMVFQIVTSGLTGFSSQSDSPRLGVLFRVPLDPEFFQSASQGAGV
jgi:hypothetical protein